MDVVKRIQVRQQAVEEDQGVRYLIALGNDPEVVLELCSAPTIARLVSLHSLTRQQSVGANRRLLLREVYATNHHGRRRKP